MLTNALARKSWRYHDRLPKKEMNNSRCLVTQDGWFGLLRWFRRRFKEVVNVTDQQHLIWKMLMLDHKNVPTALSLPPYEKVIHVERYFLVI